MSVTLVKDATLSLSKIAPSLQVARVGLGWDVRQSNDVAFDLDAIALSLDASGHATAGGLVFYNQLRSSDGAVAHLGDNRSGNAAGDDESIVIDLARLDPLTERVVIAVSIHQARERYQSFGMVRNAYIRLLDDPRNVEVARFDLSEDAASATEIVFGELYRHAGEFRFRALGEGYSLGLSALLARFGLSLEGA